MNYSTWFFQKSTYWKMEIGLIAKGRPAPNYSRSSPKYMSGPPIGIVLSDLRRTVIHSKLMVSAIFYYLLFNSGIFSPSHVAHLISSNPRWSRYGNNVRRQGAVACAKAACPTSFWYQNLGQYENTRRVTHVQPKVQSHHVTGADAFAVWAEHVLNY